MMQQAGWVTLKYFQTSDIRKYDCSKTQMWNSRFTEARESIIKEEDFTPYSSSELGV